MASESRITRVAQTLTSVTSKLFRCHGLQYVSPNADRLGGHDLIYWILFAGVICGWFLFIFAPNRERLAALEGRRTALLSHQETERRELKRLKQGIASLNKGDSLAWERAARGRLGWVEPGEVTDVAAWKHAQIPASERTVRARQARRETPAPSAPPSVLPRPRIPSVPMPPSMSAFQPVASFDTAKTDLIGPTIGTPPVLPAPARPVATSSQREKARPRAPKAKPTADDHLAIR